MPKKKYLHWKGPGFYAGVSDDISIYKIADQSCGLGPAKGLAKLIGFNEDTVAYLTKKPEDFEFLAVIDETTKDK